ncbi:hypothetical protein HAPAU_34900 [Halalkalicoccus paucihalophilus]|uniref:DUF3006 domain-containing protein n=1 Tax=Halalkalicoccus paucihalophilus TaxID=1008153 RepID=A0A151AAW7_9EURY|nr:hypothetical protein [Halalkalicoccus paucihalophilus]KYH24507.1 hypothetical protein HAPAU_34900 [Halalkalicoccus paucihalophilus]
MTLPDGTYTGTIDRIEERIAVILIEDEQDDAADPDAKDASASDREVIEELHCSAENLSQRARDDLGVVRVTLVDGEIDGVEYQPQVTKQRRSDFQDRFDALAERPPRRDEE